MYEDQFEDWQKDDGKVVEAFTSIQRLYLVEFAGRSVLPVLRSSSAG